MAEIVRAIGSGPLTDSPIVCVALEHLSAIEKQLKNEDIEYGKEAMQHLSETVDAIKELEHARRTTREVLEEETIINSKLRFTMHHLPSTITRELEDSVTMAREANASQIHALQKELKNIMQEIDCANKKQLNLESLNSSLCKHGTKLWDHHEKVVEQLNIHMGNKADKNIDLNETYNNAKDARLAAIDLHLSVRDLEEDMVIEREQYAYEMEKLNKEIAEMQEILEAKKMRYLEQDECHGKIKSKSAGKEESIDSVKEVVSNVNSEILQLKNSSTLLTKELDQRKMKTVQLSKKKSYLELQLANLQEECKNERDRLRIKIATLEEDMEEAEKLNEKLMNRNIVLNAQFMAVREEEDAEYAIRQIVAQEFEKAKAELEEKLEQLANLRMEIEEMEAEIEKLKQSNKLVNLIYGTQLEESREYLNRERQKRMALQIKKDEMTKQAELWKLSDDAYLNEMTEKLGANKARLAKLSHENVSLQDFIENLSEEIKCLAQEKRKAEKESEDLEQSYLTDIETLEIKSNSLKTNIQKGMEELKVKLPVLQESQDTFEEQTRTYEDLKQIVGELKKKKRQLEESIKLKKQQIDTLSKFKHKQRCELKTYRQSVVHQMKQNIEEMKTVEKNIYEINRQLEIVDMENCRLKLNNEDKIQEIRKIVQDAEKQKAAALSMENHLILLYDLLMKGWAENTSTWQDFSERDQETLCAIKELVKKIQKREKKIGILTNQLQEEHTGIASLLKSDSGVDTDKQ